VLDEVQRAPELLSYLQGVVDDRARMGDFVITGSQQFGLLAQITQSLAGRVGLLQLLPLSQAELALAELAPKTLEQAMWRGGYPALFDRRRKIGDPGLWLAAYTATYIERDVRQLLGVANLTLFQRFVLMCAARTGQLLNLSALASDCGISHTTARSWLTVLEASWLVFRLPPHHRNFGKRLVKTPKLYLLDSGLLCQLLRITRPEDLQVHAARGAVFESWAVAEVLKHRHNHGWPADLYFWRDNHGLEIDLLVEHQGRLLPLEVKSGITYASDWMQPLRRWRAQAGEPTAEPVLLWGGEGSHRREDHWVLSWRDIGRPAAWGAR
jgi:uncharacterized protein